MQIEIQFFRASSISAPILAETGTGTGALKKRENRNEDIIRLFRGKKIEMSQKNITV